MIIVDSIFCVNFELELNPNLPAIIKTPDYNFNEWIVLFLFNIIASPVQCVSNYSLTFWLKPIERVWSDLAFRVFHEIMAPCCWEFYTKETYVISNDCLRFATAISNAALFQSEKLIPIWVFSNSRVRSEFRINYSIVCCCFLFLSFFVVVLIGNSHHHLGIPNGNIITVSLAT